MAMDFFEHQEIARKRTGRLVVLFIMAVIAIMAMVYVAVAIFMLWMQGRGGEAKFSWVDLLDPWLLLGVGLGTLIVIGLGTLYKVAELRSGGRAVAGALGGRLVDPDTTDADERKLLNVVEEMAIASGTPVPPVYVMDSETSINAFAAGYAPSSAVIGVTRGTIALLDRDELQGVIAHEFSHILNGDMRLNIRLIAILNGILVIGLIGSMVMRAALYSGAVRTSRRDRGGNALPLVALGAALTVIGYAGTFFGSLIKAAVSRQREFLADAAAVQFTRYPDGIAGALRKIGGLKPGSKLASSRAEEMSHMFFGQAIEHKIMRIFNTHPDLRVRIKRIQPSWDGTFPEVAPVHRATPIERDWEAKREQRLRQLAREGESPETVQVLTGLAAVAMIGSPTQDHIAHARSLVDRIPERIKREARSSFGGRAVIYLLLLDDAPDIRSKQLNHLVQQADRATYEATRRLEPAFRDFDDELRLPLIDLAMPALREMSREQYDAFRGNVEALIHADERVDVFEWVLRRLVVHDLDGEFGRADRRAAQYYSLDLLGREISALLSTLAYAGSRSGDDARRAFEAGAARLDGLGLSLLPADQAGTGVLDAALEKLSTVTPRLKKPVLEACATAIIADREVTTREAELLRAIAVSLDCPMPPLLPGQKLG